MLPEDLAFVKSLPGNEVCSDCGTKYPQWASVSFGTVICLECAGVHRSLGVHISFVRSIAMDSWTDSQLKLMKTGGNDKFNNFLKSKGMNKVKFTTNDAVNGGVKKKYDNDTALLYKMQLKAKAEGKPVPTEVPKKAPARSSTAGGGGSGGAGDPNGMERLAGETDSQYIARQTRLREEAKARMAAKFGNSGGGMSGKRVMGGVGSSPHPSQSGMGFDLSSLSSGLSSVTTSAASGIGSAWSLAKDTAASVKTDGAASGVSEFRSSLWNSISQVSQGVAKEINAVVNTDDDNTFSELNQQMKAQSRTKGSSAYSGFGSQDLMAKSSVKMNTTSAASSTASSSNVDSNSVAALPGETDQQYMERQLRIQQEAKARLAAKFGNNPRQAMSSMSVGAKKVAAPKASSDDFFASFGT